MSDNTAANRLTVINNSATYLRMFIQRKGGYTTSDARRFVRNLETTAVLLAADLEAALDALGGDE